MKAFKSVTALLLAASILPISVQAQETEEERPQFCNIKVEKLDYKNATLLDGGGKYTMPIKYSHGGSPSLSMPEQTDVEMALRYVMEEFKKEGVDLKAFGYKPLTVSIVNAHMPDVWGHAFVAHEEPTIYLYGDYIRTFTKTGTVATIIHELGHYIEKVYMTDDDIKKYAEIKGISNPVRNDVSASWERRLEEIFADDFKQLFSPSSHFTPNRGIHGSLTGTQAQQVKDLILSVLPKGDIMKSDDMYRFMTENDDFGFNFKSCESDLIKVLKEPVAQSDIIDWVTTYLTQKDEGYKEYVVKKSKVPVTQSTLDNWMSRKDVLSTIDDITKQYEYYTVGGNSTYWKNKAKQDDSVWTQSEELNDMFKMMVARGVLTTDYLDSKPLNLTLTRGEAAHLVYLSIAEGNTSNFSVQDIPFEDVPKTHQYAKEIQYLFEIGVIKGKSSTNFGFNDHLTRQQMMSILNRVYEFEILEDTTYDFKDIDRVSSSFKEDVKALIGQGVVKGNEQKLLKPRDDVKHNELLLMLNRAYLTHLDLQPEAKLQNELLGKLEEWEKSVENMNSVQPKVRDILNILGKDYMEQTKDSVSK